jgi:hypothetical protein
MAHAASRRPLTAEDRVRSRVSPRGICGGKSGTGTGFSASSSVFLVNFITPVFHYTEKTDMIVELRKKQMCTEFSWMLPILAIVNLNR